ncbi:hypothetical protein BDZ89DRAFT_1045091 [Hymenopellis radicata]|nr:hypothetical protein BDZ89DRAFT_1045091 [Hymenopellis radicata]
MPLAVPEKLKKPLGPPQALVSRIAALKSLLENLPKYLPQKPENSHYHFDLDPEIVEDGGVFSALSRRLESSQSGGTRLTTDLIAALESAIKLMSDTDRTVFTEVWIERLIDSAKLIGAHVRPKKPSSPSPSTDPRSSTSQKRTFSDHSDVLSAPRPPAKKQKCDTIIIISDSEDDSPESPPIVSSSTIIPSKASNTSSSSATPSVASTSSTSKFLPPKRQKQMTLGQSGWQQSTQATRAEWFKKSATDSAERRRKAEEAAKRRKLEKKDKVREQNKVRAERFRDRKKAEKEAVVEVETDVMAKNSGVSMSSALAAGDIAAVSRQNNKAWGETRNGTKGGAIAKSTHTWTHHFLWILIMRLDVQGVLAKYPELVDDISKVLRGYRDSGLPVNVGRATILALIRNQHPELLEKFRVSERWVHAFMLQSTITTSHSSTTTTSSRI